jgi:riboflavin synthase alpha subunit
MQFKIGDRVKTKDSITLQDIQACGSIVKKGICYTVCAISRENPPIYKLKDADYLPESFLIKIIPKPKW